MSSATEAADITCFEDVLGALLRAAVCAQRLWLPLLTLRRCAARRDAAAVEKALVRAKRQQALHEACSLVNIAQSDKVPGLAAHYGALRRAERAMLVTQVLAAIMSEWAFLNRRGVRECGG